jgi:hypothetical protein
VRFARWSALVSGGRQNDNLSGQKLGTTTRYQLGGTFSLRASRVWNASLRGSLLTMRNATGDTASMMAYTAWSLGMGHSFAFGARRRIESLSLDLQVQRAGDPAPLRSSTRFSAQTLTARLTLRVSPDLQVFPNAGLAHSRSDTLAAVTRATYGAGAAWRLMHGRLSATGMIGRSRYGSTGSWTGSLGSTFHLTSRDDVILTVLLNRYTDTAVPERGFNEETLNVRWARRL